MEELDLEIPDYNLKVICKCGEEYEFESMDYYVSKTNHTRHSEKGKHGIEKIINMDTGETVETEKDAINEGWILSTRDMGKYNKAQQKTNRKKSGSSSANKSTIVGELLNTEVYIHPYVYENFIHCMNIWPDRYQADDAESFSQYILDMVIFFRMATDQILPWGDLLAESVFGEVNPEEETVEEGGENYGSQE